MSQSWSGIGSSVTVPELTEFIRHAAQEMQGFAQCCNPPTGKALGLGAGDTVQYTYFSNISVSGGRLDENEDIPEGSIVPISGSYQLFEYGNSTKWTGKLDALCRLPINDGFVQVLINDMHKAQNSAAFLEFDATSWIANFSASGNEFRTDGVSASFSNATGTATLTLANLRYLNVQASNRLIPYFDGESYVVVTGVTSADTIRYDTAVSTMLQHDSGRAALNGEVGRLAECRIVKDNHKVATALGSTGSVLDAVYLLGADAVTNEYAIAPEIRAQDAGFGRSLQVAWYFIAAWKKIYSQSVHSKEHVIKMTGKA